MKVRFSVLIPVHNIEKYVRQTIDSVLSQAFTDYEVIVIDDGSTDQTPQVLESYGTRIKVVRQPNRGPEAARNKAAALAHGEYLAMLDHDDLLLPCALATYDRIIRTFDSPPLIIGSMKFFRDGQSIPAEAQASRPVEILRYPDYLSKDVPIGLSNSRLVIRKSVFDEVGGYGNRGVAAFPPDDFNLILKIGTYGPCLVVQKPYTVGYREHETNTIRNLKAVADGFLRLARFENQGRYPGGSERRWARYAILGGVASSYAISHCWRGGHRKLALRLLLGMAPMVFAAVWKKFLSYLRKPTQPIVLPEQ
ncbi:MAG: glycosyltransferase family 2 protein [Terriglobia bacterium]|jgi:glycosyltransferase involved in cell wall biosynthesis